MQMAVQWAQQELPELAILEPERIALYLNVNVKGQAHRVRIGAMSWEDVVKTLAQYEIIEVVVENPRSRNVKASGGAFDDAPPCYPYDEKYSHSGYLTSNPLASNPSSSGSHSRSRSPGFLSRAFGWVKPTVPEESD